MQKEFSILVCVFLLGSCTSVTWQEKKIFNPETVKEQIQENGEKWGEALRKKDSSIIASQYDQNAHYIVDKGGIISGNKTISEFWQQSFDFLGDLGLNMQNLEGTKDLLYETGTGWVTIKNEQNKLDTLHYNYCNVWKLQPDGTYKVVIDMFNDIPDKK